ncbi:hypothetical protein [Halostella pelagica]|uniref:hypothetical protein n=1 Tax=Halostella pelagica TaxID=2583824 RepID=UPI00107FE652|nr:hypothetical protein [Halostella pelagica]
MKLPRGQLLRSRVVADPGTTLSTALETDLTGYAVFEPRDALLLDADGQGVLTFEAGVPVLAYHTRTDAGGATALADLAVPGPYSVDLFELDATDLAKIHDTPPLRVAPGLPAERLAGDPSLADRTRDAAPADRVGGSDTAADGPDAVAAFLDDEEKITAIREQARSEARDRAQEWGLADELANLPGAVADADDDEESDNAAGE